MRLNRREFISRSAVTAVGLSLLGGTLARAAGPARVVVMLDLDGGNDGLNTVVPLGQYDRYRSLRRSLAIDGDRLLRLKNAPDFALNPSTSKIRLAAAVSRTSA